MLFSVRDRREENDRANKSICIDFVHFMNVLQIIKLRVYVYVYVCVPVLHVCVFMRVCMFAHINVYILARVCLYSG